MWNIIRDESSPDRFHQAIAKVLHKSVHSPMFSEGKIPFGLRAQTRLAAIQRTRAFDIMDHDIRRWSLWLDPQQADLRTRIKEANSLRVNTTLVVGDKEAAAGTVSVRRRGAAQGEEERGVAHAAFGDLADVTGGAPGAASIGTAAQNEGYFPR